MTLNKVEQLAEELRRLFVEDLSKPFPYVGSRWILGRTDKGYEALIPDLDMYFSEVAGYCSWGKRILRWPKKKLLETQERLKSPFFDQYPEYRPLKKMITETDTPDLYAALSLYERTRMSLLELLSELLSEPEHFNGVTQQTTASQKVTKAPIHKALLVRLSALVSQWWHRP